MCEDFVKSSLGGPRLRGHKMTAARVTPPCHSTSPTFRLNICIRTYVWILCAAVFYSFTRACTTRTARTPAMRMGSGARP